MAVTGSSTVSGADKTVMTFILPSLSNGTYVVQWKAMSSVDGHLNENSYVFRVGSAGGPMGQALNQTQMAGTAAPADIPGDALKWSSYVLLDILLSSCFFALFVWGPTVGRNAGKSLGKFKESFEKLLAQSRQASLGLLLAVSVLVPLAQAAELGPASQILGNAAAVLSSTGFGNILLARIAIVALILVADVFVLSGRKDRSAWIAGLFGSILALLTISMASHTAASSVLIPSLNILTDLLHQAAGMLWLGSIFFLTVVSYRCKRSLGPEDTRTVMGSLMPPFHQTTFYGLAFVALSGVYLSWADIQTLENLFTTAYGQSLLIKLAIVGVVVVFGFLKRNEAYRAFARGFSMAATSLIGAREYLRPFISDVGLVAVLAFALFLSITILTTGSPPMTMGGTGQAGSQATTLSNRTADLVVNMTISPFMAGTNDFSVSVSDRNGNPAPGVKDVKVSFVYLDKDIGRQDVDAGAPAAGGGSVSFSGDYLALAGNWTASVTVVRQNAYDAGVSFNFDLPPSNSMGK